MYNRLGFYFCLLPYVNQFPLWYTTCYKLPTPKRNTFQAQREEAAQEAKQNLQQKTTAKSWLEQMPGRCETENQGQSPTVHK